MFTLDYLAKYVNGKLEGSPKQKIEGVCEISNGIKNKISFISNSKYLKFFNKTQASAVIVGLDFIDSKKNINLLKVKEPSLAFIKIAHLFKPKTHNKFGIHPTSIVDKDSTFGSKVSLQPNVTIEKKSKIGNNVVIGSNSYIGSSPSILNSSFLALPGIVSYAWSRHCSTLTILYNFISPRSRVSFAEDNELREKINKTRKNIMNPNK